ncbi:MAG: chorismate mutase [Sphingomonadaceae bacterium]
MSERRPPEACTSMAEVRAGVDALDRALIALLAERMGYMSAAARIKPDRASVRDEARKREVIANARREAARLGLDPALIDDLWERLVEASIAFEYREWDRLRVAAD